MSITLDQLQEKVKSFYPEVQRVGDTALRYTRKTDQSVFAVYYLDVGDDLPQTREKLHEYLDRVVGQRYFEGASSLQWNSYLYFIRSHDRLKKTATQKVKELVEQDRAYARKFVISESELDSVLCPKTLEAGGPDRTSDAISQWISILKEINMVEAVFGEHTLPDRMRLIEDPPTVASEPTIPGTTSCGTLLPPIRQFEIKEFRRCMMSRVFNFRDVNLLYGANGTGKTSLLEAIELFYCGKTRRNPKVSEHYRFQVSYNGKPISVNHKRKPQPLRDCNLQWYGIREQKSTNLYDGFGRFNFLNTDAAIELSQSSENIDDDLARLLVGSDAAKTWQVIEKLAERVGVELRGLQTLHKQVRQELGVLNKQLAEVSTVKKESDSLRSALHAALRRNQWTIDDDLDSETVELIAKLAELNDASKRMEDLSWLDTPVTLDIIESYCQAVDSIIKTCAPQVRNLIEVRAKQQHLAEDVKRDQKAMILISELDRLVISGIEQRTTELDKHREVIASFSGLSAGLDEETLRLVTEADGNHTVDSYQESAVAARKLAEKALFAAKDEYGDFVKLRDHSVSLAQELRSIAARILEKTPSDECPLCHTKFQPGELARHMTAGVDEHLETKVQKLLENVHHAEAAVTSTAAIEKAANQIGSLCKRMQLPLGTVLKNAMESLEKAKTVEAEEQKRVEVLESEIRAVEAQGLSISRLNEVSTSLNELGIILPDRSQSTVSSLKKDVEQRLAVSRRQMEANSQEEGQIQAFVNQATSAVRMSEDDPAAAMTKLKERLVMARAALNHLKRFLPRFRWEGSRPILEWIFEAEAVRGIATQLQAAIEKERIAAKTRSDAGRRRDKLTEQNKTLEGRIKRFDQALKAMTKIQTKHSLKAMTQSALKANRRSIETIFTQIHSPAEFKTINPEWTLVRKLDETVTTLTRISTGQRAAFALAVFLSQNAQLRSGPRVILIDDPIAHVDDLNCLSFLDYLREIALTGTRQIFFATASSKLASLFERKFDFLGEGFRRFNLTGAVGE